MYMYVCMYVCHTADVGRQGHEGGLGVPEKGLYGFVVVVKDRYSLVLRDKKETRVTD